MASGAARGALAQALSKMQSPDKGAGRRDDDDATSATDDDDDDDDDRLQVHGVLGPAARGDARIVR